MWNCLPSNLRDSDLSLYTFQWWRKSISFQTVSLNIIQFHCGIFCYSGAIYNCHNLLTYPYLYSCTSMSIEKYVHAPKWRKANAAAASCISPTAGLELQYRPIELLHTLEDCCSSQIQLTKLCAAYSMQSSKFRIIHYIISYILTRDVKTDFLAKPVTVLCKPVFYRLPDYVTSRVEFGRFAHRTSVTSELNWTQKNRYHQCDDTKVGKMWKPAT